MENLGAIWLHDNRCRFRVWAPLSERVHLHIVSPKERMVCMEPQKLGYHTVVVDGVTPETRYFYRLSNSKEFPDPVSRYQPEGVHGPSEVVNPEFEWTDSHWFGHPIEKYVIYELHVGTFTTDGTFEAVIPRLDELVSYGITAVELMPVAQYPGNRNWGYDGVFPFAVQQSYGGPTGLKKLVNACHARGLAVILDVVYNHLGPEGNCLPQFAPYFTSRYKTPWGSAVNFDDKHSREVRRYFIGNALEWITDYHIDALRLDAVHAIFDHSEMNILEELAQAVHERAIELNRRIYLIAESNLNDPRLVQPGELGGYGLDAQWNDDFHHSVHTLLTSERQGYYADFGDFQSMVQAFSEGFIHSNRHGISSRNVPSAKFVVFAQNHDQVGNRMLGERLGHLVSLAAYKLASSVVLLSPYLPLLFMGDEYGETAPFQYFVSHSDPQLVEAVRSGRKEEFASFQWQGEPPDPQDERTFDRSKLNHDLKQQPRHQTMLAFHKELLRLRKSLPALRSLNKDKMEVASHEDDRVLVVRRSHGESEVVAVFSFNDRVVGSLHAFPHGVWHKRFDSAEQRWLGPGTMSADLIEVPQHNQLTLPPYGVLVYEKEVEE